MNSDWTGLNLADLVDLLEPLPEPEPVSMVPQTAGWIWLGLALLAISGLVVRWVRIRRRKTAYRRQALAELARCPDEARRLADLLRRTALSAYPRAEVASLHGAAWLAFLDRAYGGSAFSEGPGRHLIAAPYRPETTQEPLKPLVRTWIKMHRVASP